MYTYQQKTQNTHKLILCELGKMCVYLFICFCFVCVCLVCFCFFVCFAFLENFVLLLFLFVFLLCFYEVVLHKYIITFGSYNMFPFENNIQRR